MIHIIPKTIYALKNKTIIIVYRLNPSIKNYKNKVNSDIILNMHYLKPDLFKFLVILIILKSYKDFYKNSFFILSRNTVHLELSVKLVLNWWIFSDKICFKNFEIKSLLGILNVIILVSICELIKIPTICQWIKIRTIS